MSFPRGASNGGAGLRGSLRSFDPQRGAMGGESLSACVALIGVSMSLNTEYRMSVTEEEAVTPEVEPPAVALDTEVLFRNLVKQHQSQLYRFVLRHIGHP